MEFYFNFIKKLNLPESLIHKINFQISINQIKEIINFYEKNQPDLNTIQIHAKYHNYHFIFWINYSIIKNTLIKYGLNNNSPEIYNTIFIFPIHYLFPDWEFYNIILIRKFFQAVNELFYQFSFELIYSENNIHGFYKIKIISLSDNYAKNLFDYGYYLFRNYGNKPDYYLDSKIF